MTDDLVERVAQRICNTAGSNWNAENFNQTDDGSYAEDQREYYRMLARAAIAVCMEEAAKVADAYEPRCDVCPRGVAAAIRALVKEP